MRFGEGREREDWSQEAREETAREGSEESCSLGGSRGPEGRLKVRGKDNVESGKERKGRRKNERKVCRHDHHPGSQQVKFLKQLWCQFNISTTTKR